MKSIINILANSATITDQLADGADSIMAIREVQGAQKPYVVVDFRLSDPNDTFDDQRLTEYDIDLTVVSDRVFDIGSFIGCQDLANDIRDVLHGESGNFDGEDVVDIVYQGEDQPVPVFVSDKQEFEITQQYKVYIDRVQKTLITAATYSNQDQIVTSGDTMANMAVTLTPLAATARFSVISGSLPTNATLNSTTGAISQSAAAAEDVYSWTVKVQGYGEYTGVVYATCTMSVEASSSVAISAITYTNAAQTVWVGTADAQNQGAPVTCSPDNTGQTGTFAVVGGAPAGVSVHATTGVVTYTFASLASGLTSFTVRKTGSGDYSGTQDAALTITKEVRWDIEVDGITGTLRTDASWNFYEDYGDVTVVSDEITAVKNYANTTWSQATVARRAAVASFANGRYGCGVFGNGQYLGSLASTLNANFTIWFSGVFNYKGGGSVTSHQGYLIATNNSNRIIISNIQDNYTVTMVVAGGSIVTFTLSKIIWSQIQNKRTVWRVKHKTTAHVLKIYSEDGGLIVNTTAATVSTGNFVTTNMALFCNGVTTTEGSLCATVAEIITTELDESAGDETNILDHLKYNIGISSTPPFA